MDKLLEISKQRAEIQKNSKSSREFIDSLVDEASFVEMDAFLFTKNDYDANQCLGEGVVSGYATINNSPCYIYCQNYEVLKGGLGKAHAEKIVKCMQMAGKTGAPIISILHTAGARIGEGVGVLDSYAKIMAESVKLSGIVPQICVVKGDCFGSMSYLTALSDFVFMLKDSSIVSGSPLVISANENKNLTANELGGVDVHSKQSGICDFACKNSQEVAEKIKKLLALIPPYAEAQIDCAEINKTTALSSKITDATKIVEAVADAGSFVEIKPEYASGAVCGLARIGGIAVGIIATGSKDKSLSLCNACAKKMARFVRFLDCYNIPLISLVNCDGVAKDIELEKNGMINSIASLMYAISEASIAKISIVTNQAIGVGFEVLASKSMGFDYSLAWESAVISPVSKNTGASIVYQSEILNSKNSEKLRKELEEKYEEIQSNPIYVAEMGGIDNIINPANTRQYLISSMQMLFGKENSFPLKKHGNMPF